MKADYIDHMGSDLTVVNAARVSFDKHTTEFSDKDEKLINYLARHNHWTPFGHPTITIRETVPIFVARQRFKHVVGFVYNEVSRRYVDDTPEFYKPDIWRKRAENKKQGSSEEAVDPVLRTLVYEEFTYDPSWFKSFWVERECDQTINDAYEQFLEYVSDFYSELLEHEVAPEQARMVLPQSMYTSYYVTGSLAAWSRAYNLRKDPHAQKEIQDLAKMWDTIIQPLFPVSWKALTDAHS